MLSQKFFRSLNLLLVLCSSLALGSCAVKKRIDPLLKTHLETVDTSKKIESMPFQHSHMHTALPPEDFKAKYKAIFIKPVRTDLIAEGQWKKSVSPLITSEKDYQAKAQEIAKYFRERLSKELNDHPKPKFTLAKEPGEGVVALDIALTEIEFSHPLARAGTLASPMPGTGAALSTLSDPYAAFALRMVDSSSGELLATAADRQFSPIRILDLNKLTVSSTIREITQDWSKEISEAIQEGRFAKVENRGVFRLLPW